MSEASLATLGVGLLVGYVGQRSRMCFVGGIRDFVLVRDSELLRGLIAFVVAGWLAFSVAGAVDPALAGPAAGGLPVPGLSGGELPGSATFVLLTTSAAFLVGLGSVLADGCPLRQHVMAGQGSRGALLYLAGFYAGVVLYDLVVQDWIARAFGG